jgi:uncharacterized protein YecT (DUF1311 family)
MMATGNAMAQAVDEGKIDIGYSQCMEEQFTSSGMRNCAVKPRQEWDAELNRYYKLLLSGLSAEGQTVLREAQREWVKPRDKQFAFMVAFYTQEKEGTMWHPVAESKMMEVVKRRSLALKAFYNTLEQ